MYEKIIEFYNKCEFDYKLIWRLNRYYAIHYGFYDEKHKTHGEAVINFNRVLTEIAGIESTDRVLDAGCGIGGSSIWLAKNVHCNVVGISITPEQVEKAKKLAEENGVSNLTNFYIQDYNKTSFPDKSFDVVWGLESICYAESKKMFLQEAWRVLKDGGRLIVADGFLNKKPSSKKEEYYFNNWLEGWAVSNLTSINEFKNYLKNTGFQNIMLRNVTKNVMPSSKRMYLATIFSYPLAKAMELLGLRTRVEMKNMYSAFYQYSCLKKGLWAYSIFCAKKP